MVDVISSVTFLCLRTENFKLKSFLAGRFVSLFPFHSKTIQVFICILVCRLPVFLSPPYDPGTEINVSRCAPIIMGYIQMPRKSKGSVIWEN